MGKKVGGLSIKQKLKIIESVQNNVNKQVLVKQYNCDISTINRILKQEDHIKMDAKTSDHKRRRQRRSAHEKVEKALALWFDQQRQHDAVLTSLILLNKAKEFAIKLNDEFEPNPSWLWRWRKRHNIKFGKIHGELKDNDEEGASSYTSTVLPDILKKYEPENIFNADETGLYFKALPNATFFRNCDQPKGRKSQKARLTSLLLCNATGSYKKMYVIGKSQNPRCFRNVEIPLPYFANKNAWMTSNIWNQILLSLDKEMKKGKKKIVLFVDNAACHKVTCQLENIHIEFLPPNTTALIQPLDQGVIHAFKVQYRQIIVKKQLCALEREMSVTQFLKSLTVLDALYYIKRAWWMVKPQTIVNCFKKVINHTFPDVSAILTSVTYILYFSGRILWHG